MTMFKAMILEVRLYCKKDTVTLSSFGKGITLKVYKFWNFNILEHVLKFVVLHVLETYALN